MAALAAGSDRGLSVRCSTPVQALLALNLPIITTNYDDIIEQASRREPVSYTDHDASVAVVDGDRNGVLHLHGHWREHAHVVLGIRPYERLLGDEHAQALLRTMRLLRSIIFIGFGEGMSGPNFRTLLAWSARVLAESERRSYRLVLDDQVAGVHAFPQT